MTVYHFQKRRLLQGRSVSKRQRNWLLSKFPASFHPACPEQHLRTMKTRNLSSLALLGGKPGSARQIADPTGCAVSRYGRRDARCAGWLDFSNPFDSNEIGFDRPGLHRPESRPQCTKRPNHAQPVIAGHPIGPAFIQFQPDSARPPRTLFARRIKRFAVAIGRQGVGRGPGGPPR